MLTPPLAPLLLTHEFHFDEMVLAGVLKKYSVQCRCAELEANVARSGGIKGRQCDCRVRLAESHNVVKKS